MAARGRFPAAAEASSEGRRVGATDGAVEEANPFSFKEFVRSQNQRDAGVESDRGTCGVSANSQESVRCSVMLADDSFSPKSFGLSLECPESLLSDPTAASSLLEDEEDGWSGTYQPSAIEEAHLAGVPCVSRNSTFDSFDCDSSDLPTPSLWQLRESDYKRDPVGKGDQSLFLDEETVEDGFYQPLQPGYEELKQENSKLKNKISCLQEVCEARANRAKELERMLEDHKLKEAKEAWDLEAMVQQVEENLRLMTKRAVKAENSAIKLKQENAQLQVQMQNYQLENEALKSRHSSDLAVMRQNADLALQNLLAVITKSHSSIKQLLSGAEGLQLVADLLKSIDRISEMPKESS